MNYKETLNLPVTAFPMKANLAQKELEILAGWEKDGLYKKLEAAGKGKPLYVLHDGPPYANGHIHIGHALNKILKDIVLKSKRMSGFHAPYVPGWDCHGLPIELQVEKNLGSKKHECPSWRCASNAGTMPPNSSISRSRSSSAWASSASGKIPT